MTTPDPASRSDAPRDHELLLAFYGDDFTGSTDVMEVLQWAGIETMLFLDPPDVTTVRRRFPQVQAVGVAGVSRSLSPAQMDETLPPILDALSAFDAAYFHYKICSTFDSSPQAGSIGHAIGLTMQYFAATHVPLVVGAPALKRYVAFGNLFARVDDRTYRLDRHPTMPHHPVTPMHESDLRLHLAQQTQLNIDSISLLHLEQNDDAIRAVYQQRIDDGAQIILLDTINTAHLSAIGRLRCCHRPAKRHDWWSGRPGSNTRWCRRWLSREALTRKR